MARISIPPHERSTPEELLHHCIQLLNASRETTVKLVGNGLVAPHANGAPVRRGTDGFAAFWRFRRGCAERTGQRSEQRDCRRVSQALD